MAAGQAVDPAGATERLAAIWAVMTRARVFPAGRWHSSALLGHRAARGGRPVPVGGRFNDAVPTSAMARRVAVAVAAGVVCLLAVLLATGLLTGRPVGAGDNGDGHRLYCGAGLVPATPDGHANWKGGVVLRFDRVARCPDPVPSSAGLILRAAAHGSGDGWSLTRLGWLYAALAAAVAAIAAFAATGAGLARVVVLVPVLVVLADPDFARFFLSTYSEPAGLLGGFAFACGVAVVAVTGRAQRVDRLLGLVLVAGGGLLAATAKTGYAPLLVPAALVCAVTAVSLRHDLPRWSDRLVGPLVGAGIVLAAFAPVTAALDWQARATAGVNSYDLTFTTVLTEVPDATAALGLPPAAAGHAGESYYLTGRPRDVPGAEVVLADPTAARDAALHALAAHPLALLRSVGVGMQAIEGQALTYLPSAAWTPSTRPVVLGTIVGEQGANGPTLRAWLAGMSVPWWPDALAGLGIAVGIAGTIWRVGLWSVFARVAGVTALSAVGLAAFAVLGDGFFEIAKHVWLAAYLLDVTAMALLGALGVWVVRVVRTARDRQLAAEYDATLNSSSQTMEQFRGGE
ncbi:MAG TPA: hypothetical protein VH352_22675 [Pseudonocardiaceae bacterium]|nr:hypothetical protein [Pseudonocardiaceae bacterium]